MTSNTESQHNFCPQPSRVKKGFTLLEITVVIVVLLTLITVSALGIGAYERWKLGAEAGTTLRTVYNAQRTYLAEHPTEKIEDLTAAKVIPYLSDGSGALPTIEALDGTFKTIKVNVSPPVIVGPYDPSGSSTDGQWDVGE